MIGPADPPNRRELADQLLDRADALWTKQILAYRDGHQFMKPGDRLVAEIPVGMALVLTVVKMTPANRHAGGYVLRVWRIGAGDRRQSASAALVIGPGALPRLAEAVAAALAAELEEGG